MEKKSKTRQPLDDLLGSKASAIAVTESQDSSQQLHENQPTFNNDGVRRLVEMHNTRSPQFQTLQAAQGTGASSDFDKGAVKNGIGELANMASNMITNDSIELKIKRSKDKKPQWVQLRSKVDLNRQADGTEGLRIINVPETPGKIQQRLPTENKQNKKVYTRYYLGREDKNVRIIDYTSNNKNNTDESSLSRVHDRSGLAPPSRNSTVMLNKNMPNSRIERVKAVDVANMARKGIEFGSIHGKTLETTIPSAGRETIARNFVPMSKTIDRDSRASRADRNRYASPSPLRGAQSEKQSTEMELKNLVNKASRALSVTKPPPKSQVINELMGLSVPEEDRKQMHIPRTVAYSSEAQSTVGEYRDKLRRQIIFRQDYDPTLYTPHQKQYYKGIFDKDADYFDPEEENQDLVEALCPIHEEREIKAQLWKDRLKQQQTQTGSKKHQDEYIKKLGSMKNYKPKEIVPEREPSRIIKAKPSPFKYDTVNPNIMNFTAVKETQQYIEKFLLANEDKGLPKNLTLAPYDQYKRIKDIVHEETQKKMKQGTGKDDFGRLRAQIEEAVDNGVTFKVDGKMFDYESIGKSKPPKKRYQSPKKEQAVSDTSKSPLGRTRQLNTLSRNPSSYDNEGGSIPNTQSPYLDNSMSRFPPQTRGERSNTPVSAGKDSSPPNTSRTPNIAKRRSSRPSFLTPHRMFKVIDEPPTTVPNTSKIKADEKNKTSNKIIPAIQRESAMTHREDAPSLQRNDQKGLQTANQRSQQDLISMRSKPTQASTKNLRADSSFFIGSDKPITRELSNEDLQMIKEFQQQMPDFELVPNQIYQNSQHQCSNKMLSLMGSKKTFGPSKSSRNVTQFTNPISRRQDSCRYCQKIKVRKASQVTSARQFSPEVKRVIIDCNAYNNDGFDKLMENAGKDLGDVNSSIERWNEIVNSLIENRWIDVDKQLSLKQIVSNKVNHEETARQVLDDTERLRKDKTDSSLMMKNLNIGPSSKEFFKPSTFKYSPELQKFITAHCQSQF